MLRNPATMVQDLVYGGPQDPNFPQRGYLGSGTPQTFRFRYKLPQGVSGDRVMMQWRYVTANSCAPPGYRNNQELVRRGWARTHLPDCRTPNFTGARPSPNIDPEQFFSCAEIKINPSGT